jgi:hypothetical protein
LTFSLESNQESILLAVQNNDAKKLEIRKLSIKTFLTENTLTSIQINKQIKRVFITNKFSFVVFTDNSYFILNLNNSQPQSGNLTFDYNSKETCVRISEKNNMLAFKTITKSIVSVFILDLEKNEITKEYNFQSTLNEVRIDNLEWDNESFFYIFRKKNENTYIFTQIQAANLEEKEYSFNINKVTNELKLFKVNKYNRREFVFVTRDEKMFYMDIDVN